MATIDVTTDVGRMRMRLGDFLDIQQLPDSVYVQTLLDTQNPDGSNNLRAATILCGQYILASLAFSTHTKLATIEVYGAEAFKSFKQYLLLVVKDPSFNSVSPIPYAAGADTLHPILKHQQDWLAAYTQPTSDQSLSYFSMGEYVG